MRIVYLHQYFHTPGEVGGTRSFEMARRFVAAGHEVHVVTSDQGGGQGSWRDWEVEGIQVHSLPVAYDNAMGFRRRLSSFLSFALRAGPRAAAVRPDVVFATSTPLTIALPAAWAKLRRRVPVVFEVRDLWPEMPIAMGALRNPVLRWAARRLERFAYAISDRVVALSPGMAAGVVATGYPEDQVVTASNACDVATFAVPPSQGQAYRESLAVLGAGPLVVYCGTFGRVNDVGWLADVARELLDRSDTQLLVVGRGAEEARIVERARAAGVLDRNLHVLGPVPKQVVPSVLSAADVVLSLFAPIPEMEVNSANKFFDGLAAGRPVAINYGGWQADILRDRGAGLVLPHDDPAAAASALDALAHDPARLRRAGEAAHELARGEFDRDRLTGRVLDALVAVGEGARS